MIGLILQLGLWVNTDGGEKHVPCPLVYEQEQRLPVGCMVLNQGVLYTPTHYIDTKVSQAEDKTQIIALQEQVALLRAELLKAQNEITKCLIQPQVSTTQPFIYGVLSGAIVTGAILWNK